MSRRDGARRVGVVVVPLALVSGAVATTEGSEVEEAIVAPPEDASSIVREHGAYAWRTLRLLGVRAADLDDVTQEVLLVAIRGRRRVQGPGSLRAWIRGICVKKAAGHRRRARFRYEVMSDEVPDGVAPDRPDDALAQNRQLRRLGAALDGLDERQRVAFVLYEIEGLSMKDVAEAMGCPLPTAYARHRTARSRIVSTMRRLQLAVPDREEGAGA